MGPGSGDREGRCAISASEVDLGRAPEREPPNNAQEPPKNAPDFSSLTDEELEVLVRLSRKIRYVDTRLGG